MENMTYSQAGVDITNGNKAVDMIKPIVKSTFRPEVVTDLGGFGGLFALNKDKYEEPILISGTDGVGTKLKVAFDTGVHNTIGIDAVAMCVNDVLVNGAEPLFFLDYLAVGKLEPEQVAQVVEGVAEGCRQAGCALIGGETAEMPGFYTPGEYDVAGFTVGIVDKKKMIDGSTIKEGDVVLGLPSSGLHSNGYSLARKVMFEKAGYKPEDKVELLGTTVGEAMLKPTRIYVKSVLALLASGVDVHAISHITGGGFYENIPRSLPAGLCAEIAANTLRIPPIFNLIAQGGSISQHDMFNTFNMGVGMCIIVAQGDVQQALSVLYSAGEDAYVMGKIVQGSEGIVLR